MGGIPPLLLGSSSPRRAALLAAAGVPFEVAPAPDVDETPPAGAAADEVPLLLARRKALACAARAPGRVVLGADTVVILDGEILNKPGTAPEARRMLAALSGRTHRVVTGVAVTDGTTVLGGADVAEVEFGPWSAAEIDAYVATGEPLDKAGAYAIQGGAARFVVRRTGRLDTVVGLPVPMVVALVRALADLRAGAAGTAEAAGPGRSPRR